MAESENRIVNILKEILKDARQAQPAREAVAALFPKAEASLKTFSAIGSSDAWERRRSRGISAVDCWPTYFRLDPTPASWSLPEIERILNEDDPTRSFEYVDERLASALPTERARLRQLFLDEVRAAFRSGKVMTEPWLRAIVAASPAYIQAVDQTTTTVFPQSNQDRLRWTILDGLEHHTPEARTQIFSLVATDADDLTILCDVFRTVEGDLHPSGAKTGRVSEATFGDFARGVRDLLSNRVKHLSVSGDLWRQASVTPILWFWWGCNLPGTVRGATASGMETSEGLRALLDVTVHTVYSSSGNYETVNSQWSNIVDLDKLTSRARAIIAGEGGEESDRILAERYLSAIGRESASDRQHRSP